MYSFVEGNGILHHRSVYTVYLFLCFLAGMLTILANLHLAVATLGGKSVAILIAIFFLILLQYFLNTLLYAPPNKLRFLPLCAKFSKFFG